VSESNARILLAELERLPEAQELQAEELHEAGAEVVVIGTMAGERIAWRASVRDGGITVGPDRADPETALREAGLAETTARNVAVVRRHYEAFNADDVDAIVATLHPEIEISGGDERAGGGGERYRGLEEARDFFVGIKELVADNVVEVLTLEASKSLVVASVRLHGTFRESGRAGSVPAVHFLTVRRGLVARIETYRPDWRREAGADTPSRGARSGAAN
jgi:ketosteroid isomerase-like protein